MYRRFVIALLAVAGAGCGGSKLPALEDGRLASYRDHVEPVVVDRCLSCHTAEEPKAELVLEPGQGYDQLTGRASVQVPAMRLVVPGDLADSYLWRKLDGTATVGEGMPRTLFGTRRLPEPELERFRRWIEDGALP